MYQFWFLLTFLACKDAGCRRVRELASERDLKVGASRTKLSSVEAESNGAEVNLSAQHVVNPFVLMAQSSAGFMAAPTLSNPTFTRSHKPAVGAHDRVGHLGLHDESPLDESQWRRSPRWPIMAEQIDQPGAKYSTDEINDTDLKAISDLSAQGAAKLLDLAAAVEADVVAPDEQTLDLAAAVKAGTDQVWAKMEQSEPQSWPSQDELMAAVESEMDKAQIEKEIDMVALEARNAQLKEEVATFKEELEKLKSSKTQAESITENVIRLPGVIVQNINFLKESIDEKFGVDCGPEEIQRLKEIIEKGSLQIQERKGRQLVKIERIGELTSRIVAEVKRRAAFQLQRGGQRWNDATLPVGSLGAAYARSLLVCAAMVGIQTVGPSPHMPGALCGLLAQWAGWREGHQVATNVPTMFLTYMATDTVLQTMEVQSMTTAGERAGVDLKVARMVRTGLVSGFLTGFMNTFYHRWIQQLPFPFPGFLQGQIGLAARICAALPVLYMVAIDLVFWEPIFSSMYITLQALLRGQPMQIIPELKAKVLKIWAMSPRYWLWADLITFSLVSVRLRPLGNALFGIPWGAYLSRMANMPDFESPNEVAQREYAQLIVNNLESDGGKVDDDQFKQFWTDNKVNSKLAGLAGARRKGFWWQELGAAAKRKPVEELVETQQAGMVVKLLAELKPLVPADVMNEMRLVLAQVKEAEDSVPQDD